MYGVKQKSDDASDTEYAEYDIFNDLNLSRLAWSKRRFTLKEFADMFKTPQMILICKGQYRLLEYPSELGLDSWIFAWCKDSRFTVQAQCLHSETRNAGHPFEIKDDYDGFFEILSKEILQIKRVSELANYPNKHFMLMESMSVYKWSERCSKGQMCVRHKGYQIIVDQIFTIDSGSKSDSMLRCYSFSGETVFLPMEETGNFTMIGQSKGLQTISSLKAFHHLFPIDVRLMYGRPPPGADYKKSFSPYMRFNSGRVEEFLTIWTMDKGSPLMHIPVECPMEVRILENLDVVLGLPIHKEIIRRIYEIMQPPQITSSNASLSLSATTSSIPLQSTSGFLNSSNAHIHRSSTSNPPTIIATTDIPLPTSSDHVPVDVTDIQQLNNSSPNTTTTDIHQSSTFGLCTDQRVWCTPSTANVFHPWTSYVSAATYSFMTESLEDKLCRKKSEPICHIASNVSSENMKLSVETCVNQQIPSFDQHIPSFYQQIPSFEQQISSFAHPAIENVCPV